MPPSVRGFLASCTVVGCIAASLGEASAQNASAAPVATSGGATRGPVERMSLDALGLEYRKLRTIPSHMGAVSGPWVDAVDASGGRKELVMGELGRRLDGKTTRARVIALLGVPDRVIHAGDPLWVEAQHRAGDGGPLVREMLVYWWRGAHDFLIFDVDQARVTGSHWYYAME